MANGSLKWNNHITGILQQIEDQNWEADQKDDHDNQDKVDEVSPEDEEDNN